MTSHIGTVISRTFACAALAAAALIPANAQTPAQLPTAAQTDPKATRDTANEQANLNAAKDAWPRTIQFFNQNLRR